MSEENFIHSRIKELRNYLQLDQKEMARRISRSVPSWSAIENGRNKLTEETILLLVEKFKVNPTWLLLGQGAMLLGEELKAPSDNKSPEKHIPYFPGTGAILPITVDSIGNETIQQVSSRARASYMNHYLEPEYLRDLPTISLPGARWRNGTFRAFEVAGDSMQTTLHAGDIVIAQKLYNWPTEIREGYVHIIVTHDDIVVKRVLNRLVEAGQLALQSDNIQYPTQLLEGDDVREVWLAKAYISSQFTNTRFDSVRELANTQADVAELFEKFERMQSALKKLTDK